MAVVTTDPRSAIPDLLTRQGFRLTTPRRAVLEVLCERDAPLSVAEIRSRLKSRRVNLVSVYRSLNLLVRLGVARVSEHRGTQRFELTERYTGHHHHVICQLCGRMEDLQGCLLKDDMLTALNRRVLRSKKFRVTDHELQLFGLCRACDSSS
jgi:Fur family ferric uptake transcriptional regulator